MLNDLTFWMVLNGTFRNVYLMYIFIVLKMETKNNEGKGDKLLGSLAVSIKMLNCI